MKNIRKIFALIVLLPVVSSFSVSVALARDNVSDWYIKDFKSGMTLNKDSSLSVVEDITADCGNAYGKHGIFRVLPTQARTPDETIDTPVELVSITDFNGTPRKFQEIRDYSTHTVTWKIGDPNVTVSGVNDYRITYRVKNAVRFGDLKFDEFYWNLNGNFWDIETDAFTATINFPVEVKGSASEVWLYSGDTGVKGNDKAGYNWIGENTLEVKSTGMLGVREGITASVTLPKNVFTPYVATVTEKYASVIDYVMVAASSALLPFITFIVGFFFWWKYGKEDKFDKAKMPEFTVPDNLSPLLMGMVKSIGIWDQKFLAAGIVSLATKGVIEIKEIDGGFFAGKDYEFTLTGKKEVIEKLDAAEVKLLDCLFGGVLTTVRVSALKNSFVKKRKELEDTIMNFLTDKDYLSKNGREFQKKFAMFGVIGAVLLFFLMAFVNSVVDVSGDVLSGGVVSVIISIFIVSGFSAYMNKRTLKGAETNWHIDNLEMYMKTAEKDRMGFYEKENIFEKFLPYAIAFGITDLWIKRMRALYGEEYFNNYHPVWYYGAHPGAFSMNSFASSLNSMTNSISSNMGTTSGSRGGGSSGGGGGGGGGGGW